MGNVSTNIREENKMPNGGNKKEMLGEPNGTGEMGGRPFHVVRTNDMADSIEIGTPAKGGAIKVYGNSADPEDFTERIKTMAALRKKAQELTGISG
jgi:hypothetical protein